MSNIPFSVTLISFVLAAVSALVVIILYFSLRRKEREMPSWHELQNAKAELSFYAEELDKTKEKYDEVRTIIDMRDQYVEENEKLKEEFDKLTQDIADLDQYRKEIEDLKLEHVKLTDEKSELQASVDELKEKERDLTNILNEGEIRKANLENEINQKTEELNQKKTDVESLEGTIEELKSQVQTLKTEFETTKELYEKQKLEYEDMNERLERRQEEVKNYLADLQEEFQNKTADYERRNKEVDEAVEYIDEKMSAAEEKHDDFKVTIEEDRAKLIEENNQVRLENSEIVKQTKSLEGEIEGLEKNIDKYQKMLEALQSQLGASEEDDESLSDLWEPVNFNTYKKGEQKKDEKSLLENIHSEMDDRGLVYHPRVIRSFHTNLKINEISPLTVLAGISGTGKSLLPKEYCRAMGINFLSLAVQPRWDSPQDLFGFYNYMERKYKATDLAKAMIEFEQFNIDQINKFNGAANVGRRFNQMLLVLFDEMNLARIEYYFSEFLSKLETRREIDTDKDESRSKAEIHIDAGHGKSLPVFPGDNLLFVGTMNEDESTQSLSDKVLDRASVMRFGKPSEIKKDRDMTGAEEPENFLSAKKWNEWIEKDISSLGNDFSEKIETLNSIMYKLQKPFAHRVGQAISQYILNYPDFDMDSKRIALADQIEQRIIPKLRGVSVQDHQDEFKEINDIIGECDEPLAKEFSTCIENANSGKGFGTFNWLGFDRS